MTLRDTVDKAGAADIPGIVQEMIYLTAVFNSCLNSFVYGAFYYTDPPQPVPSTRARETSTNLHLNFVSKTKIEYSETRN